MSSGPPATAAREAAPAAPAVNFPVISTALALLITLLYVVGLLAVNIHLHDLGVYDFSVLKPRYVYTGVLAVVYIAAATAFPLAGLATLVSIPAINRLLDRNAALPALLSYSARQRPSWLRGRVLPRLWMLTPILFLVCLAIPWIIFKFLLPAYLSYEQGNNNEIVQIYFKGLLAGLSAGAFAVVVERLRLRLALRALAVLVVGIAFLVCFNLSLWLFGTQIYPKIPEEFGGGKVREVQLLIGQGQDIADVQRLGIGVLTNSRLTLPVQVLFEGTDTYTVGVPEDYPASVEDLDLTKLHPAGARLAHKRGDRVVQIDKHLVQAIVVVGEILPLPLSGKLAEPTLAGDLTWVVTVNATFDSCTTAQDPVIVSQTVLGGTKIVVTMLGTRGAHATCQDNTGHAVPVRLGLLPSGHYVVHLDGTMSGDKAFDVPPVNEK